MPWRRRPAMSCRPSCYPTRMAALVGLGELLRKGPVVDCLPARPLVPILPVELASAWPRSQDEIARAGRADGRDRSRARANSRRLMKVDGEGAFSVPDRRGQWLCAVAEPGDLGRAGNGDADGRAPASDCRAIRATRLDPAHPGDVHRQQRRYRHGALPRSGPSSSAWRSMRSAGGPQAGSLNPKRRPVGCAQQIEQHRGRRRAQAAGHASRQRRSATTRCRADRKPARGLGDRGAVTETKPRRHWPRAAPANRDPSRPRVPIKRQRHRSSSGRARSFAGLAFDPPQQGSPAKLARARRRIHCGGQADAREFTASSIGSRNSGQLSSLSQATSSGPAIAMSASPSLSAATTSEGGPRRIFSCTPGYALNNSPKHRARTRHVDAIRDGDVERRDVAALARPCASDFAETAAS